MLFNALRNGESKKLEEILGVGVGCLSVHVRRTMNKQRPTASAMRLECCAATISIPTNHDTET